MDLTNQSGKTAPVFATAAERKLLQALWGITDELGEGGQRGFDGTDGNFPLYTLISGNTIRELGIFGPCSNQRARL